MSTEILAALDDVLKVEVAQRHSYFQLKYFVIGKEPTHQSRMWQCLRELKSRKESLVAVDLEIEETKDRLELLDITEKRHIQGGVKGPDELDEREYQIKLRQIARQKKGLEENLGQLVEKKVWIEQEARFFLESYKNLEKLQPLKHFDDLDAQKEYWSEKLSRKLNLKMLLQSPLDTELVDTVLALPDDIPVKVQLVNRLNHVQSQLLMLKEEMKNKLESKKED